MKYLLSILLFFVSFAIALISAADSFRCRPCPGSCDGLGLFILVEGIEDGVSGNIHSRSDFAMVLVEFECRNHHLPSLLVA